MNKINKSFVFPLLALAIIIISSSNQIFNVPPLEKLLNPFVGAVQNDQDDLIGKHSITINNQMLKDKVKVYYDTRKVPHIYANNLHDLYFAQGYVTAYFRLWQMDFLSYAAAGRMSEIFDRPALLDYDRLQRRTGMLDGAKRTLSVISKDKETKNALSSYTEGVNAYIANLNPGNLPFEYKLLDYKPEPWTNIKTILVFKTLANTLSGYEQDMLMSKMLLSLGEQKFNMLFPDYDLHSVPVVNKNRPSVISDSVWIKKPDYLDYSFISDNEIENSSYNPKLGSNSWAISGKKTSSGYPILANDPHLTLTLPSIWMEIQLTSPDLNVYGVSLPGTPAVIIGFNKDIAWGVTNGDDDVKDWYKLTLSSDKAKYKYDAKWKTLKRRVEIIKRRGHEDLKDTVYSSIHGPIVYSKSFVGKHPELVNYALKWEMNNTSNEFSTFLKLNKAKNYPDYLEAIKHYSCPIMNFTFACKDNTIAINHQGKLAVKTRGQGKFVMDGSQSALLPTSYIPFDSLPHVLNPESNYVLSANQHPTYSNYRYYYNGYYSETRAIRINEILQANEKFNVSKVQTMQLDNVNSYAKESLPVFIENLSVSKLSPNHYDCLKRLKLWKYSYDFGDQTAILFDLWLKNIKDLTWDELPNRHNRAAIPKDYVLLDLINQDPTNNFFDILETESKESASEIIRLAFSDACETYLRMEQENGTTWGSLNKLNIMHMTNIPTLSAQKISSAGNQDAINAKSKTWGPSWRMIVELGPRPRAYGIYPGGQSGNVGSKFYRNYLTDWNDGKYNKLMFFVSESEASKSSTNNWTINPKNQ